MTAVEFSYRLTGTGWAEARLADQDSSAGMKVSYVGDALGQLLEAVGRLLEGAPEARLSWDEEPGEYRWIFQATRNPPAAVGDGELASDPRGTEVHLRVLSFENIHRREPDAHGALLFETRQLLATVATAIAQGAQAVLDEYGEEEYLLRWIWHPFPAGQLTRIRERLSAA
jgi:hypothetical protein